MGRFNKIQETLGKRFGRLIAIETRGVNLAREYMYLCDCDCGKTTVVRGNSLRKGLTQSCGCLSIDVTVDRLWEHGLSDTAEHDAWANMIASCYTEKFSTFRFIGAKGIRVVAEWVQSFVVFLADVGMKPSPEMILARIDMKKDFQPGNVKWMTRQESIANRNVKRVMKPRKAKAKIRVDYLAKIRELQNEVLEVVKLMKADAEGEEKISLALTEEV